MILITGLGNPGKEYEKTRHNIGFRVIDELAKQKPNDVVLLKPQTFMNNSGDAVIKAVNFYKMKPADLWVVHDDVDLPLGEFKISKNRGSAGHKGVQSIIKKLGTRDFNRVRIGICPLKGKPTAVEKFVLQNFTKEEEKIFQTVIPQIIDLLKSDINKTKNYEV
ncbi:MAG: aminoacyl-tRNA hydrolase [Candidatus Nealsonbacteria bacterium]